MGEVKKMNEIFLSNGIRVVYELFDKRNGYGISCLTVGGEKQEYSRVEGIDKSYNKVEKIYNLIILHEVTSCTLRDVISDAVFC